MKAGAPLAVFALAVLACSGGGGPIAPPANQPPTLSLTMNIGQQTRSLAEVRVRGTATDTDGTVKIRCVAMGDDDIGFSGSFGASFDETEFVPKDLGMQATYGTNCTATDDDDATATQSASVLLPTATGAFHDGLEAAWHFLDVCLSTNPFIQPAPGNKFVSVDVSVASILTDTPMTVNPFDFVLLAFFDDTFDPTLDCREPSFPLIAVGPGQTVRGWITYEVPASVPLSQIGLQWVPFNTTINMPRPR